MVDILCTDIQLDFSQGDIKFDNDSDFKNISGVDNLKQAIIARLYTKKGDLRSQPNYGSTLHLLTGSTPDDDMLNLAGSYVYESLFYEPRIDEIEELTVEYRVVNGDDTLIIFLKAKTIETDVTFNLVIDYTL